MKHLILSSIIALLLTALAVSTADGVIDFHQIKQGNLRYFESEQVLREWVETHKLSVVLISSNGCWNLTDRFPGDPRYDCDDYAEDLRRLAEADGYILTPVPVENGQIWGVQVIYSDYYTRMKRTVGNWTMVGNTYYYVEPFPLESKVIRICDAD